MWLSVWISVIRMVTLVSTGHRTGHGQACESPAGLLPASAGVCASLLSGQGLAAAIRRPYSDRHPHAVLLSQSRASSIPADVLDRFEGTELHEAVEPAFGEALFEGESGPKLVPVVTYWSLEITTVTANVV